MEQIATAQRSLSITAALSGDVPATRSTAFSAVDVDNEEVAVARGAYGGVPVTAWRAAGIGEQQRVEDDGAAPSSGYIGGLGAPGTGPYTYDGTDGYTVGGKRFQGVHVMDSETGRWTTPDAYAGDVHDPMSQKPFMWNRNNPYEYSDPSGYDPAQQEKLGSPSDINRIVGIRGYGARMAGTIRRALKVPEGAPKISEANADHMFQNRPGHVPDSALNRALFQRVASVDGTKVASIKLPTGSTLDTYAKILPRGKEVWVEVNSQLGITNGGVNDIPRWLSPVKP